MSPINVQTPGSASHRHCETPEHGPAAALLGALLLGAMLLGAPLLGAPLLGPPDSDPADPELGDPCGEVDSGGGTCDSSLGGGGTSDAWLPEARDGSPLADHSDDGPPDSDPADPELGDPCGEVDSGGGTCDSSLGGETSDAGLPEARDGSPLAGHADDGPPDGP